MTHPIFARLAANMMENDKFRGIPTSAGWDWVKLVLFSVRNESDGFISQVGARDLVEADSIQELISRNLLEYASLNTSTQEVSILTESEWNQSGFPKYRRAGIK